MKPVVLGMYVLTAALAGWCFVAHRQRVDLESQRSHLLRTQRENAQKVAEYEASIKSLEEAHLFREQNERMLSQGSQTAPLWQGIALAAPKGAAILRMEGKQLEGRPGMNVRVQLVVPSDAERIEAAQYRAALEAQGMSVGSLSPQVSENSVTVNFTVAPAAPAAPET